MANNTKPRLPLNINMPSAPIAAELPPLAREEYLTARNKVATSVTRKKQLEAALLGLECELWDAEGAYLAATSPAQGGTGSVVRGFESYLKPAPSSHPHGRRDRRSGGGDRQASGDDDDLDAGSRVFSNSSFTAEASITQRQVDMEAVREKEREARLAERRAARASLNASRTGSPHETIRERSGTKVTISRASPRTGSPSASARSSPAPSGSTPKRTSAQEGGTSNKKRRSANHEEGAPRKKKIVARAGSPLAAGSQAQARRGS